MSPKEMQRRLAELQNVLSMSEPQVSTDTEALSEVPCDELRMDNIEMMLPVNDSRLYLNKVYGIFKKIMVAWKDMNVLEALVMEIDRRMDSALAVIENMESGDAPEDLEHIRSNTIEGFNLYYEGLACLRNFVIDGDEGYALDALDLVYQGDRFIQMTEVDLENELYYENIMAVA